MKLNFKYLVGIPLTALSYLAFGQEDKKVDVEELFRIDTPITIELEEDEFERVEPKKKKQKRNTFFGIKTKKGFTKNGFGDNVVLELFYYLKDPIKIDPYVNEIYWFDFRRKAIRAGKNVDPKYGVVLHGPYKKMKGKQVLEEGYYYEGAKHGRWTTYNNDNTLITKTKYHKGWYKESLVSFYDLEHTQLREVIPVQYGKRHGEYFYFHPNGNIAVSGKYENDVKIGVWTEFYEIRGRRKKMIQYTEDHYNKKFQPVTLKEWNDRGQLIYDRETYGFGLPDTN